MAPLLGPLLLLPLGACTGFFSNQSNDPTIHQVESPYIPGGADWPNRRQAEKVCPQGYQLINVTRDNDPTEGGTKTTWTIRCL